LEIKPGQVIALVGESGVGKSTTISLISGYYFPTQGSVHIDGIDTRKLDLTSLRQQIGVVPQEVALFNDTLMANIRYGTFGASEADVLRAAKEAHMEDFISALPHKYETIVGERGIKLSVGQKQRVAIARAILRNPSILILDEPTSALDAQTEQIVTGALEKLMHGKTTFIIAHRLSTVRKADMVLVFQKGKIVEKGTHNELVAKEGGVYRRLYDYQIGLH
jgi:subfamily B ATP-binding cassette protein MsbA